jgi:DNA invertase Pin-like site-specific DNA recombinase
MLDGYLRYRLEQRGMPVLSATQANGIDPISKLTQSILAAVAGYERHLISQRLAGSRRVKAAQGGYAHGRPPFGFKSGNGYLAEDADEQLTLSMMWAHRDAGLSYAAIAEQLNATQRPTRTGRPWLPSSVYEILTRGPRKRRDDALAQMQATDEGDPLHEQARLEYEAAIDELNRK